MVLNIYLVVLELVFLGLLDDIFGEKLVVVVVFNIGILVDELVLVEYC